MNRERLTHLAREVLPFVDPDQFNMDQWKCGTAACAVGWHASTEWANNQGLRMALEEYPAYKDGRGFNAARQFYGLDTEECEFLFAPDTYADGMWDAYKQEAIDTVEAKEIIDVSPAMVAARIETLLAWEAL